MNNNQNGYPNNNMSPNNMYIPNQNMGQNMPNQNPQYQNYQYYNPNMNYQNNRPVYNNQNVGIQPQQQVVQPNVQQNNEANEFHELLNKVGIKEEDFMPKEDITPKEPQQTQTQEEIIDEIQPEITPATNMQPPQQSTQTNDKSTVTFSVLERYGEDITKKTYITNPAIAREQEISKLILVLLTPDKSACLVGKPGIGKTAIVEGLAYRILNDNVPNILKGYSIINIATSSLLGESVSDGERDSRIQLLVNEVMKSDKIILFIDEIHTLMGAGAKDGSALDFANILKPALARGNVKLIGATTSDEYERYMIRDRAFIRRFEKIDVAEPDIPTTVKILMGSYPRIEKQTGVKMGYTDYVKERIMTFIVEMTSEYKRYYEVSSRYPDISLALLSKAFSFAMFENSDTVKIKHVWMAVCTCNSIYPDSRTKEIERFKTVFADLISEENLDVNTPIDV
ncbi:MAG: ATP-dependent Clp protease ATP-binding subunit [Bacilli bacterium]|nr:ATP-dependent Clp protease ATP-binding subunit [Bacilli bacterium]